MAVWLLQETPVPREGHARQPVLPRHLFTVRGESFRVPFGTIGDICFEPRYREIYLTDLDRNQVWVLDSAGFPLDRFGSGISLDSPKSVAVAQNGHLFVTTRVCEDAYRILLCDPLGHSLGYFPPTEEEEPEPEWVNASLPPNRMPEWARPRFSLHVGAPLPDSAERGNEREALSEESDCSGRPLGKLEMGMDGCLYVPDTRRGVIFVYRLDGSVRDILRGRVNRRSGKREKIAASGLAVGPTGKVYVTDIQRGNVVVYHPRRGEIGTVGERGGATGKFSFPTDLALDKDENLFVVDRHRHTILAFDPEGRFLYEFGGKGRGDGFFFYPSEICIDDENRIWITDASKRIQVFKIPEEEGGSLK